MDARERWRTALSLTLAGCGAAVAASDPLRGPVGLPQNPGKHRSERPIFLVVDQQLGELATLGVAPELADPVGAPVDPARTLAPAGSCSA